jgi:ABC-type proline/glycine betaine transport system substrate-binding protein
MAKMGIAMPKYCENRHRSARFSDAALNALAQPQGGRVRGARGWGKRAAV